MNRFLPALLLLTGCNPSLPDPPATDQEEAAIPSPKTEATPEEVPELDVIRIPLESKSGIDALVYDPKTSDAFVLRGVERADFGEEWPYTTDRAVLVLGLVGDVSVRMPDGQRYAVNGLAANGGLPHAEHYRVHTVGRAMKPVGPLIEHSQQDQTLLLAFREYGMEETGYKPKGTSKAAQAFRKSMERLETSQP